jgi:DNA-binding CsgD family transcriptional regulator
MSPPRKAALAISAPAERFEREQIASGRPVTFVHPLVAAANSGEVPGSERLLAHRRAAQAIAAAGGDAGRIAGHLVQTEPAGDAWTAEMLRTAAGEAAQRGAPEAAARWLARALAALEWGDALWATHQYTSAVAVFDRAIETVRDTDSDLALRIEAHALAAARLDLGTCRAAVERLARYDEDPPASTGGRLIAGVLAVDRALAGRAVKTVVAMTERMLDGGRFPAGRSRPRSRFATNALLWSERFAQSRRLLEEMIAAARAAGSARGAMIGLCWRGHAAHRIGRLGDAASDLATALELASAHSAGGTVVTQAMLAEVLVDQGDLDGASDLLATISIPDELPGYIGFNYLLHARGVVRAAQLQTQAACEDFLACGTRQDAWDAPNPAVIPWRSSAALAAAALGNHDQARELTGRELQLARRFGTPRAVGIALRAHGLVHDGTERIVLLGDAVAALAGSEAVLEHARALIDLGGALRRTGERAAAREPLRDGLKLAVRCGAAPLTERARHELRATGSRPRKHHRTGFEALTPIEHQAAKLAADGLSNPQIAQALFISRKTVEKRLREVYRKLAIHSREQLAEALNTSGIASAAGARSSR